MPHKTVAIVLAATLAGAMITSGVYARWSEVHVEWLGSIGILPFAVAVVTVVFLAVNSSIAQKSLANTAASLEQARKAEVATRFQKGLELLESSNSATRIGGIAVLRDVAVQAPRQYWPTVATVLTHLVEGNSRALYNAISDRIEVADHSDEGEPAPRFDETGPDVVSAMDVLGLADAALKNAVESTGMRTAINLSRIAFSSVTLANLDLRHITIRESIIHRSALFQCDLRGMDLGFTSVGAVFRACRGDASTMSVTSTPWTSDTVQFIGTGMAGAHFVAIGGLSVSMMECDVTNMDMLARKATLEACWYFSQSPRVRGARSERQFWEHEVDVADVEGKLPTREVFGLPRYREAAPF